MVLRHQVKVTPMMGILDSTHYPFLFYTRSMTSMKDGCRASRPNPGYRSPGQILYVFLSSSGRLLPRDFAACFTGAGFASCICCFSLAGANTTPFPFFAFFDFLLDFEALLPLPFFFPFPLSFTCDSEKWKFSLSSLAVSLPSMPAKAILPPSLFFGASEDVESDVALNSKMH